MTSTNPLGRAACALLIGAAVSLVSAQPHTAKEANEDIKRHRALAAVHEAAAKCLESGKKEDVCLQEMQAACKGLAVGKYCGMRHAH